MPKGSASNRRSTSQTQADSLPLLATPTHGFQTDPSTYLEPSGDKDQQVGSGAAQDSCSAYLDGRRTGSDMDGSGESFNYRGESGSRTASTATRHSPISSCGRTLDSLPTYSF